MNILVGGRRTGKTYEMILESRNTGFPIIVGTMNEKMRIMDDANENGISIPGPMTWFEFENYTEKHRGDRNNKVRGVLIDDLERVLLSIFKVPVEWVTIHPTGEMRRITAPINDKTFCEDDGK